MTWLSEWGTFAAALTVLFLPGGIAALVVGLRGFTAAAAAGPLSLAAIGAASLVGIVLPFRWGALAWVSTALLLVAAAAGASVLARRAGSRWREHAPIGRWATWLPFSAVGVASLLLVPRLLVVFADPQNISQTFDNIYHLNAVRWVLDTGQLAPTRQLIPGFYPSLWHALTATVAAVSGASIPAAVNVVSVLVAGVLWPLGCVLLTRQIMAASTPGLLAAGALAAGIGAFPLLMLDFGVLYPNVLSIALLPAVLAALVSVCGLGSADRPPRLLRWILLLAWVPTLALAHPSTLMALIAIGFWPAMAGFRRWHVAARRDGASPRRIRWGIGLWTTGLAVATALLVVARPSPGAAFWGPSATIAEALLHVVGGGLVFRPPSLVVGALVGAGIVVVVGWQRDRWWLVAGWATLAGIYVVCAAFPPGVFRYGITGTWYSDLFRVAALLPTVMVPLGAVGFAAAIGLVARGLQRSAGRAVPGVLAAVSVTGLIAVVAVTQVGANISAATAGARAMYVLSSDSPLLTTEERDLILRLADHVPADDVVIGSPWTGTSLSYALADRRALIPHIYADLDAVLPPDTATIVGGLVEAADDPAVCQAVMRTGARWVLDFGPEEIHNDEHVYPGLVGLDQAGIVELVDSEGPDARLYRVTACE